jgi:hypothetical protein
MSNDESSCGGLILRRPHEVTAAKSNEGVTFPVWHRVDRFIRIHKEKISYETHENNVTS